MADAVNNATCGSLNGCPAETPICVRGVCSKVTCTDIIEHCHVSSVAGVRARQLCPKTCGCAQPRGSLALALPSSGCGSSCVRTGEYTSEKAKLPCEDVSRNAPEWLDFLDDWYAVAQSWPFDWRFGSEFLIAAFRLYGCDYLGSSTAMKLAVVNDSLYPPFISGINACIENGMFFPIKPLSYFCPVACGCRSGDAHCPDTCPLRTANTSHCPSHQLGEYANPFYEVIGTTCPVQDYRNYGPKASQ